jgi:integron integrase
VTLATQATACLVREPGGPFDAPPPAERLVARVRAAMRLRHMSPRTEEAYLQWMRRYFDFHGRRHPASLGAEEVAAFLSDLATRRRVSASTQNQALAALLFLYGDVLGQKLPWLDEVARAPRPARLPTVLSREEVRALLDRMEGVPRLMASLLYGSGLRLMECCRLRVKDVDIARRQIVVREGKGSRDRATLLPQSLRPVLASHLEGVRGQHQEDVAAGAGFVALPAAVAAKLPSAGRDWAWQWAFPATRTHLDLETRERRRHHLHETVLQGAVRRPSSPPGSRNGRRATRSATRSRRTCSKTATTSARCRSCSATATSRRR